MNSIILFLYTLGIHIGNLFIYFASFFSQKLRTLWSGRQATLKKISQESPYNDSIWVHCASLGEFEQGRPVIETIRQKYPDSKLILSFFSPSGYEIRKDYPMADEIIYLPSDLVSNARALIDYFKPSIFIIVKYEFWWNLIAQLQKNKIKTYLISGIFRESNYFFQPGMSVFQNLLREFDRIFVQDEASGQLLQQYDIHNYTVAGDTRTDRVTENAQNVVLPEKIQTYVLGNPCIVYGSIWLEDVPMMMAVIKQYPKYKHIIAPHDIGEKNISAITKLLDSEFSLYSDQAYNCNVLIINNIGMLNKLYSIANIAYIGGGFGKGIHNILEASVFGIPVIFGPKYKKFKEAVDLVQVGAAFVVHTPDECLSIVSSIWNQSGLSDTIANATKNYFDKNRGATDKIIRHLDGIIATT